MKFKHPVKPGHVVLPHLRKDMAVSTLRNIYRQVGWNWNNEDVVPGHVHKDEDSTYRLTFSGFPAAFR